jgi:hypothetical protein
VLEEDRAQLRQRDTTAPFAGVVVVVLKVRMVRRRYVRGPRVVKSQVLINAKSSAWYAENHDERAPGSRNRFMREGFSRFHES